MKLWFVLMVVAVASALLSVLIDKTAKPRGKWGTANAFLFVFGLLLAPTSLIIGVYVDKPKVQLAAAGVFLLLAVACLVRMLGKDE